MDHKGVATFNGLPGVPHGLAVHYDWAALDAAVENVAEHLGLALFLVKFRAWSPRRHSADFDSVFARRDVHRRGLDNRCRCPKLSFGRGGNPACWRVWSHHTLLCRAWPRSRDAVLYCPVVIGSLPTSSKYSYRTAPDQLICLRQKRQMRSISNNIFMLKRRIESMGSKVI